MFIKSSWIKHKANTLANYNFITLALKVNVAGAKRWELTFIRKCQSVVLIG